MARIKKTKKAIKPPKTAAKKKIGAVKTLRRKPAKKPVRKEPKTRAKSIDQIAQLLANEIQLGNLKPGAPIPIGYVRAVLKTVSEKTIIAALEKLAAQGIVSHQPDGSFAVTAPK